MDPLQRQYLIVAYELAKEDPVSHAFNEEDVTNHVDLDPSDGPAFATRFRALTQYHLDEGYIASVHKGSGSGRGVVKLTRKGIAEAERLNDPVVQRQEQRQRLLKTIYVHSDANPGAFVYWQYIAPDLGLEPDNGEHLELVLGYLEYLERSDLISIEVDEGTIYRITEKGVNKVEGNDPQQAPNVNNTFNLSGDVYQSAIGTHNTNTFSGEFDFSTVEQRIEAEGGADKEELRELVAELRDLLEHGGEINKGFLSRWNEKLKQYDWLAGAVAGWLLNFATRGSGG